MVVQAWVFAVVVAAGSGEAGSPPPRAIAHAGAIAFSPVRGGWTEVLVSVRAGDGPWRGSLALAGQRAKVRVALAIPAHGQRVLALPFWMDAGERAASVWLDGTAVGAVMAPGDLAGRVLVVDGDRRLPATSRAYEALDLVILPVEAAERLPPAEVAALDAWVRWGGIVAITRPGGSPEVRAHGRGAAVVSADVAGARVAFDRFRGTRKAHEDPAMAVLRRWEQSRPAMASLSGFDARPGGPFAVLVAVYAGLLGAVGLVAVRVPVARRAGLHVVLVLVLSASVVVWSIAMGGGPKTLRIHESTLVAARPDGEATLMSTALRVRAYRSATTRWTSLGDASMFYEVEGRRAGGDPQRAIGLNVDDGQWARAWSVGETALVRGAGMWRDLGVRVHAVTGGKGWRVENHGTHTLRGVIAISADGTSREVGDLPPSRIVLIDALSPTRAEEVVDPFWTDLVSSRTGSTRSVLLARLDPPIASLRFVEGAAQISAETHLIASLPPPSDGER